MGEISLISAGTVIINNYYRLAVSMSPVFRVDPKYTKLWYYLCQLMEHKQTIFVFTDYSVVLYIT